MDVTMILILIIFCTCNLIETQSLISDDYTLKGPINMEFHTDYGKCTKKLSNCRVKTGDLNSLKKSGAKGDTGDKGEPGDNGVPGTPGKKGETGDRGLIGSTGVKGPRGAYGVPGFDGPKGYIGLPGDMGSPGAPGIDGDCSCVYEEEENIGEGNMKNKIWSNICNSKMTDGTHYFYIPNYFEAFCNQSTSTTCIQGKTVPSTPKKEHRLTFLENNVWLSQQNAFDLKNIYGLNSEQIVWIHRQAIMGYQTLRIYAKNLQPFNETGDSIDLLSWNDIVIKPGPTAKKSSAYSVIKNTCSASKDTSDWCYVEIKLTIDYNRLPIIDIQVKRNEAETKDQYIYVENVELCFGKKLN